jgi:hypothetical protein
MKEEIYSKPSSSIKVRLLLIAVAILTTPAWAGYQMIVKLSCMPFSPVEFCFR